MPEFLLELYVARSDADGVERAVADASLAAEALTREGTPVRCLSSIFVPEDETCFHVLDGPSSEAVAETAKRAGISTPRITETVP
jgi:Nickel responsive protein SCO4226-like